MNHLRTICDHQVDFLVKDGKSKKECKDHATVTAEDGTLFKDIVFRLNSKGKVEIVNLVKATCRKALTEARKAAKEAAAKAEARKAKKREADRRYRPGRRLRKKPLRVPRKIPFLRLKSSRRPEKHSLLFQDSCYIYNMKIENAH